MKAIQLPSSWVLEIYASNDWIICVQNQLTQVPDAEFIIPHRVGFDNKSKVKFRKQSYLR